MSGFSNILKGNIEYESIKNCINVGRLPMGVIGLTPVHKAHYISSLCQDTKKKSLIICPDEGTAVKMCEDLNVMSDGAYVYPARDYNFRPAESQSREFEQRRLGVLSKMLTGDYNYILCSVEAAVQFTLPDYELSQRTLNIQNGEDYPQNKIIRTLMCAGYVRSDTVDGIGQFSVRGGILDVFPPSYNQPVRIEFWGDTVDSISLFDAQNQRRTQTLDSVSITPACEILFDSPEVMKAKLEEFITTVKGKGVSFMEDQVGWHGKAPNDEQYAQAMEELNAQLKELEVQSNG